MPITDVTNTLIANISSTEQVTSNVDINRSTGSPAFNSSVAQFVTYASIPALATGIPLPIAKTVQVYIRNIDPTNSVTVTWTPTPGVTASIITLYPGDQIILWQNTTGVSAGISALSVLASANFCLIEYFLGG